MNKDDDNLSAYTEFVNKLAGVGDIEQNYQHILDRGKSKPITEGQKDSFLDCFIAFTRELQDYMPADELFYSRILTFPFNDMPITVNMQASRINKNLLFSAANLLFADIFENRVLNYASLTVANRITHRGQEMVASFGSTFESSLTAGLIQHVVQQLTIEEPPTPPFILPDEPVEPHRLFLLPIQPTEPEQSLVNIKKTHAYREAALELFTQVPDSDTFLIPGELVNAPHLHWSCNCIRDENGVPQVIWTSQIDTSEQNPLNATWIVYNDFPTQDSDRQLVNMNNGYYRGKQLQVDGLIQAMNTITGNI